MQIRVFNLPATGGPTVIGIDMIPKRKPSPCVAPCGPRRSKAIGPSKHTKQPSLSPISRVIAIRPPKFLANGMHAVRAPSKANEHCCIRTRFIPGQSATLPKISRPTPDVAPMHMTRMPPFTPGRMSDTCFT